MVAYRLSGNVIIGNIGDESESSFAAGEPNGPQIFDSGLPRFA
jgi:hypothetical protein